MSVNKTLVKGFLGALERLDALFRTRAEPPPTPAATTTPTTTSPPAPTPASTAAASPATSATTATTSTATERVIARSARGRVVDLIVPIHVDREELTLN